MTTDIRMTDTETNLNAYIDQLRAELVATKQRVAEAEEKFENLRSHMESDRYGWAEPRRWQEDALPVPRLELRWERVGEFDTRCVYALVHRHLDGNVIGKPLGQTTVQGVSEMDFWYDGRLHMPVRDGAHARSDARQLGLPLYITTTDGDAVVWEDTPEPAWGTQRVLRRATRAAGPIRAGVS